MKTHFLAHSEPGQPSSHTQFTQFAEGRQEEVTLAQRLRRQIKDLSRANSAQSVVLPHLFTMYVSYARKFVHPRLSKAAAKVLQRLYLTMRSEASLGTSMPVTTRHLESLIRLSQARARIELRDEVK